MRKIVAVIAVACALGAHAEERTVSTAQELYEAITALNSGPRLTPPNVIYLEPGDYDMSAYQMNYYNSSGVLQSSALSHISLGSVNLIGKSDNPRNTVIYGNRTLGIVRCHYASLQNLTVSNGYLNVENTAGAGVGSTGAASIHSNVVVTCCTLDVEKGNGGGVAGGTWYDSTIISNSAARTNGGGTSGGSWNNCTIISNYCKKTGGGTYYGSVLRNCRVLDNYSGSYGGGVGSTEAGTPCSVYGGVIAGNTSSKGGGVAYSRLYGGTVVSNNVGTSSGGGIYISEDDFVSNTVVCCNTASGAGGGICGAGLVVECDVFGNSAGGSGGGVHSGICEDCIITNNSAASYGGGGYGGAYTNCLVAGNTATRGGGLYSNLIVAKDCVICGNSATRATDSDGGGGCYGGVYTDCTISNNLALYLGGGCYGGLYTNCLIACNMATSGVGMVQGGGMYGGTAHRCVISNNLVQSLGSHATGGGMQDAKIYDSVVTHNLNLGGVSGCNAYGGGANGGTISNSLVAGNAVYAPAAKNAQGGGGYSTTFYDCRIINNYLNTGSGAGMNGGYAYGCLISNNVPATSGGYAIRQSKRLENCEIVGVCNVYSGPAINCRFVNFTNGYYLAEGENVYKSGHVGGTATFLLNYGLWATNCLVANNRVGTTIFNCGGRSRVSIVNCTVADNVADATFAGFQPTSRVNVVNCIFAGNKTTSGGDNNMWYDGDNLCISNMTIRNCLVGPGRQTVSPGVEENTVTCSTPGFVKGEGRDYYALKHSSPARGKGLVQDWMTDALDIRQDPACPRLRDGAVDIGCYQCWLDPVGLWFSIR